MHFYEFNYNEYAADFTLKTWNKKLDIPINISFRGKSRYGVFKYYKNKEKRKGQKEIILYLNKINNLEDAKNILRHELCHWFCYTSGLDYHDGSIDFERELLKVDATSTNTSNDSNFSKKLQEITISQEGHELKTRKTDPLKVYKKFIMSNHVFFKKHTWIKLKHINSAQEVIFNDEIIDYIFKINNKWVRFSQENVYVIPTKKELLKHVRADFELKNN